MIEFTPTAEQKMLIDAVHRFAETDVRPIAHKADEESETPHDVIEKGWNLGIIPGLIPEQYGGYAADDPAISAVLALEELGWGDVSIALNILVPATFALAILHGGSDIQKKQFLPEFCDATRPSMTAALMEPSVTFDAHAPEATARYAKGKARLVGQKTYVPAADSATAVVVYAKNGKSGSTNGYIVEVPCPGLEICEKNKLMGLRPLPTFRVKLDSVNVDAGAQVGETDTFYPTILNRSRIALAALAVGQSRAAFEYARDYAKSRIQFGAPIATKQAIAFKLADMAVEVDAARLMVWEAAWQADRGADLTAIGALLKHHVAKMALFVADSAVQILGGHGYIREHPVERWLRNARGFANFEGLALI